MGIKIKNLQTGEFEKFNIPALKGEKGEPGEIEPSEKVDYIGKQHSKLRDTMNANVDYIIKTAIGEFNYLNYEGQHITATNSIEGHARSAILKGQTLNNIALTINNTIHKNAGIVVTKPSLYDMAKRYIVMFDVVEKPDTLYIKLEGATGGTWKCDLSSQKLIDSVGRYYLISSVSSVQHKQIKLTNTLSSSERCIVTNVNVVEYQEGMENWDIPYFEGMQSVKMPVLTTTGKNLVDYKNYNLKANGQQNPQEIIIGEQELSFNVNKPSWISLWYDLYLEKGEKYTLSYDTNLLKCFIFKSKVNTYVNSELVISGTIDNIAEDKIQKVIKTFIAPSTGFIRMRLTSEQKTGNHILKNLQIEKDITATSYEPHKTSILSLPEEVVLRSLPNGVCDTLNVETGEYVQRVREVVLNGSEEWYAHGTYGYALFDINGLVGFKHITTDNSQIAENIISNSIPITNIYYLHNDNSNQTGLAASTKSYSEILLSISEVPRNNVTMLKQYLSQNPITVQYELATPVVKTVDLSDNNVYSYKDVTHYNCSSAEGSLVPTLSVKVPTDTQLTIQEQKATTQTLLIKNMDLQQSIKEVQAMNLAFNTALYNSFNSIREEVEDIKKHVSTNENLEGSF